MPVQQHPIPANVTSYQFRLVGDLTLKQFLQIAAGVIVAAIFYALPLPFFLKWPLVAIASGAGAAIAFLPVGGRPLDQWLIAFIKSIYQPTIYTWQKPEDKTASHLDVTPTPIPTQPIQAVTPTTAQPAVIPPTSQTQAVSEVIPSPKPVLQGYAPTETPTPQQSLSTTHIVTTPQPQQPIIAASESVQRHAREVQIPIAQPTTVEQQLRPKPIQTETAGVEVHPTPTAPVSQTQQGTTATFATDLPIPHTPATPNTIVGMTLTPDGKILDSAIVEILERGQTIRATKSNKLGQFLFAKPLDPGVYQITADKTGNQFPRFDLDLKDKIILPIRLQATS